MDFLVATRVMGWKDEGDGWWHDGEAGLNAAVDGCGMAMAGNAIYAECIFEPSQEIAHAWAVVERAGVRDLHRTEDGWHVVIWTTENGLPYSIGCIAETIEVAICRAAIMAAEHARHAL